LGSRLLVMALCYAQPLVRSWCRYWTRLFAYRPPLAMPSTGSGQGLGLPLTGVRTLAYWSESGYSRLQLLGWVVLSLNDHRGGSPGGPGDGRPRSVGGGSRHDSLRTLLPPSGRRRGSS